MSESGEAKTEDSEFITIRVLETGVGETLFKIKKSIKMQRVFDTYALRRGLQASRFRFLLDEKRIEPTQTPEMLELDNQGQIDCVLGDVPPASNIPPKMLKLDDQHQIFGWFCQLQYNRQHNNTKMEGKMMLKMMPKYYPCPSRRPWSALRASTLLLIGLTCSGRASASSFDQPTFFSDLGSVNDRFWSPSSTQQRRSLTEATVSAEDFSVLEDDDNIMDIDVYSANDVAFDDKLSRPRRSTVHIDPLRVRLPTSFQDPFGELPPGNQQFTFKNLAPLTVESVRNFDHQLKEKFGQDFKPPLLSTGTTIAGVCGYDAKTGEPFVVLGADTRATAGRMVADKRCQKVHPLARNIWACGAGTSADLDQVTRLCRYSLAMRSLVEHEAIGNIPRRWDPDEETVASSHLERPARHYATMGSACRFFRDKLYKGGGGIGANLIVGGIDEDTGIPHIRAIHPHGSMDRLPYAALGSGGLAAMAVIESRFQTNITLEEGTQIVKEAILAGIQNDLGSGSQVDLCIISANPSTGRVVSTYTRAALAEEEIPGTSTGHRPTDSAIEKTLESQSTPGVNGFGNYPFSLRSKRLIVPSRGAEVQERAQKWDKLLGMRHDDISFLEK